MRAFVLQREGEDHRLGVQVALEHAQDRDAAAGGDRVRLGAVQLREHLARGLVAGMPGGDGVRQTGRAERPDLDAGARVGVPAYMGSDRLADPGRVLIAHQAAGDLGVRLARQHRLDPVALEASPDAVDLQRRAPPLPRPRAVAGLPEQSARAQAVQEAPLFERDAVELRAVGVRELRHAVEEAVHQYLAFRAAHRVQDTYQRVDGVVDGAAVGAGVHVAHRARHVDLQRAQAAQAQPQPRLGLAPLRAVGADDQVAGQTVGVRRDERVHGGAADLFLPLQQELDVHGQRPAVGQQCLHRLHRDQQVALVVGGAAPVDPVVGEHRIERIRVPAVGAQGRLHVEVGVDQDGRRAGRVKVVGVHGRLSAGLQDLGVLEPGPGQAVADPGCGGAHVVLVVGKRGDAGDAYEVAQLGDVAVAVLGEQVQMISHRVLF